MKMPLLSRRKLLLPLGGVALLGVTGVPLKVRAAQGPLNDIGDVTFRERRASDDAAIARLIEEAYAGNETFKLLAAANHRFEGRGSIWWSSWVAEQSARIVGVASVVLSARHPVATLNIMVAGDERRRGIGTALYARMRQEATAKSLPLVATISLDQKAAGGFSKACGMNVVMRARQRLIDLDAWPTAVWEQNALSAEHGCVVRRSREVEHDLLLQTLNAAYMRVHRDWVPVRDPGLESLRASSEGTLVPESGIVAFAGGSAVGAASLARYPIGEGISALVGISRAMSSSRQEVALMAYLLAECLSLARRRGHSSIYLEGDDDSDGRLLPVLNDVPVRSAYELYTVADGLPSRWPRAY